MYICVEKVLEEVSVPEDYVGILPFHYNALYYSTKIGRTRIYRQRYPKPQYKGLKLFTYKRKENAQKLCNYINNICNSKYEIMEIKEDK